MKIDKELLKDKIRELKEKNEVSYRRMGEQSGVHNISRIISGEIKNPTADSWWCLHNAFPNDIPEPSYIDGTSVYKVAHHGIAERHGNRAEETEPLSMVRQYRDLAEMDADTLGEIQTWIIDNERIQPGFTGWFRLEFQNRFPEFDEWKRKQKHEKK